MTAAESAVLIAVRTVVLVLGVALTALATRAYRRERTRYLRNAAVGFGIITVGVLLEGVLFELAGADLVTVHVVESVAIAVGFAVLLSSFLR